MRGAKRGVAALLACGLSATAAAGPGSWSLGGELDATYDSNVGNAGTADDTRSTGKIGAGTNATFTVPFGLFTALQLRGALDGEDALELPDLSFGRAAARVRLLNKPGEGFYVPVVAAWASAGHREYGSGLRDSDDYRAGAYVAQPLTTQLAARLAFTWSHRDARSRVFEGEARSSELGVDWTVTPRLALYAEYRRDDGPLVVSAQGVVTPKSEHLKLYAAADAVEQDGAFGWDWYAYRLDGHTRLATLGANLPLGADLSLDAQLQQAHSTVSGGYGYGGGGGAGSYGYDRWIGGVSLLSRF